MHRSDLTSDQKIKSVVKKSKKDMDVNVRDLYIRKVKSIYGQILEYATKGQSELTLEAPHNDRIAEIKIANRKMVEIIRDVKELRINVLKYTQSDNAYMKRQYQGFRRLIAKMIRAINTMKEEEDKKKIKTQIKELKKYYKTKLKSNNKAINKLIRENHINVNMASSLVNDHDNVNDIIKMILQVCELLYVSEDSLLDPTETVPDHAHQSTN
jgi:phosphate:Na+ symporter